ncbi:hypothetical protein INT47_001936 [Mucor saturninus]|uniref:Cas12f1-like TNB domain-containing protein n=1 Tax=Mucor saturninus TaxID=64648 RepID=A0A8H7RHK7_9FUNG|nr:hypothetical protein INT47_001936 [Mucor saturninus]
MRIPIYPDTEGFIKLKKQHLYEKLQQQEKEGITVHNNFKGEAKEKKGIKRKDTAEEKHNKSAAKRARNSNLVIAAAISCKSCGESGHSSARMSIPLRSFFPTSDDDAFNNTLNKIKSLSMFLRNVIYRAQLFINYYILKYPADLPNEFFQQNFWYSLCRLINENMSIESFKQKYISHIPHLEEIWTELSGLEGVSMLVKKEGLTNYGQVLASACENVATCYNNFYTENFENIVSNYFIYMIRAEFQDLRMSYIKSIVYGHILEILFNVQPSTLPENIGSSVNKETQDKIRKFLNPLIVEIKNRLPPAPITKATLNKAPFDIMPVFRHILSKYESMIEANQEVTTSIQLPLTLPQQSDLLQQTEDSNQSRKRPKKKKSSIKNKISNAHKDKEKRFQPPRMFSLFPNPSFKWRFIKIDNQNLHGIFGRRIRQVQEETPFSFAQRSFFECFDFRKLKINSLAELQSLHEKGRMFLNSFYTDGYTCRVSFCRKKKPVSSLENVTLTLNNFNSEEVQQYFRPCTVDPNRKDVFTSYHGENDVRRLSSSEYYNMNGVINRQKQELERKKSNKIEHIETRIPSPKTTGADNYKRHITYMFQHFEALITFYDFQTARIRWSNYIGNQKATDHAINILINGSTKYNKNRRKNTRRNKGKRRKLNSRYTRDLSNTKQSKKGKQVARAFKEKFEEGDKSKMPMIIFGDGLKNKSHVRFKGLRHGVIDKLYKQLKRRENLGELLLLDIDEYNTSKTCNGCLVKNLENLKCGGHKIHQILNCNNCNIFWNRDVLASKNMFTIATSIWSGNGSPSVFQRQSATSNVVAAPSSVTA